MNGANQDQRQPPAGKSSATPPCPQNAGPAPAQDSTKMAADVQKLASVIKANRIKLDLGWRELQKLEQTLSALDAKLKAKESLISKAA